MKTIMSYVLMIWAILLVGLLFVQKSEAAMPDAIDLGNISAEGKLDRCLLAIATDPNLLKKIDQKQNFNSIAVYRDVLRETLDSASRFIPYDINKPANLSDVNRPANLTVSLCLADSRVYFWKALVDRNVIGWISIYGNHALPKTNEPKVTVWVIPRLEKSTSFTGNWSEDAKLKNITSKKSLMKLALNIDVGDANSIGDQVLGKVKVKAWENHSMKIFTSGNILQAEIMLISDEGGGRVLKPEAERILNDLPITWPFWPPKEDKKKESSPN
jgi:hypothetical protein